MNKMHMGGTTCAWLKSLLAAARRAGVRARRRLSQTPVKIRLSWVAPVTNWASIWLEKKDLAKHLGKSYTVEPVRYRRHAADGHGARQQRARSRQPRLFDARHRDPERRARRPAHHRRRIPRRRRRATTPRNTWSSTDGPIKKVEDLKGKVVATNAAGSAVDVAMRAMLRKFGLEDKRDYTVVEAPFPTMRAMLAEKKVDMIPAVLPFSLDPELRKIARTLFMQRDAIGVTDMIMWTARKPFIDKNRAAHGRLHGGHAAHRALVSRPGEPEGGHGDRRRASPSSRPSASTGCSPRRTTSAIPTCCRTSTRCRRTST